MDKKQILEYVKKHPSGKVIILFILFTLTQSVGFSQTYFPILNNSTWNMDFWSYPPSTHHFFSFTTIGDTSFNGTAYKIITKSDSPGYMEFVREDAAQKKTWRYFPYINSEKILYDFNWVVGDTVLGYNNYSGSLNVLLMVDSISTVSTIAGQRRAFYLLAQGHSSYVTVVIEGIGSISHPFNVFNQYFDGGDQLLCAYQNCQLIYQDPMQNCAAIDASCNSTSISSFSGDPDITIYPNPSSKNFQINIPHEVISAQIQIRNITGELLTSQELKPGLNTIDDDLLSSGIYFYSIYGNNEKIKTGKLVHY